MGETLSAWIGLGFLATTTIWAKTTSERRFPVPGDRYLRAQVSLSLLQAFVVVVNVVLCSRSREIISLALLFHSLAWALAWAVSSSELRRNFRLSKILVWWWLAGAISNRYDEDWVWSIL